MNELPLEVAYVRSPYDLAEITSVEVNEALKLPGVVSVIKAKDIPGQNNAFGGVDEFQLIAEEWVNYMGQILAIVVAESAEIADEAASLISVEYKPFPPVLGLPEADALNSTHCKSEESISADNKPNDDELTFFELNHSFQGQRDVSDFGFVTAEPDGEGGFRIKSNNPGGDNASIALSKVLALKKTQIHFDSSSENLSYEFAAMSCYPMFAIAALCSLITGKKIKVNPDSLFDGINFIGCGSVDVVSSIGFDEKGKIKSFESNIKLDCGSELGSSSQFLSGYISALKGVGERAKLLIRFEQFKTNQMPSMSMEKDGLWIGLLVLEDAINQMAKLRSESVNKSRESNMNPGKVYARLKKIYSKKNEEVEAFNRNNDRVKKGLYLFNVNLSNKPDQTKESKANGALLSEVVIDRENESINLSYTNIVQEFNSRNSYNQNRSISVALFLEGLKCLQNKRLFNLDKVKVNLFPEELFCDVISVNEETVESEDISLCFSLGVHFAILEAINQFDGKSPLAIGM